LHTNTIRTRGFFLNLFALLGMMLLTQFAMAEGDSQAISRSDMTTKAMRGTYMFSTGNIDDPGLIFAPNFVRHEQQYLTPEAKLEDISKLIKHQSKFYKVEDIQTEPLDIIVDVKGNRAAVRWAAVVKRLPTADAGDAPGHMKFEGVTISRFDNGKISEQWVYYDANLVLTLTRLRYADYFQSAPAKAE
jgi:hypothetical protein